MIKTKCSNCNRSFNAPEKYAGKKVKCPNCGSTLVIPALEQTTANMDSNINSEKQKNQVKMPQEIKTALSLLWISLGLGILNSMVMGVSGTFKLTILAVVFVFMAFLFHRLKKGEYWARLIFLILFAIGIPTSIPLLINIFWVNSIVGLLCWTITILQVIAIVFLFLKPSSDWFGQIQNQKNKTLFNWKTVLKVVGGFFLFFFVLSIVCVNKMSEQQAEQQARQEQQAEQQARQEQQAEQQARQEQQAEQQARLQAEQQAKTTPKLFPEGETVSVGYTSYAVWNSWWSSNLSHNQYMNEKPNAMFLFVSLTVRNDDTKARSIPPFSLIDESGNEYESSSKSWSVEGSIEVLDSLNPDVKKQGLVVFDVPVNHRYMLKVSGGYWSGDYAFIVLSPKYNK